VLAPMGCETPRVSWERDQITSLERDGESSLIP
jgi:hypothetical protein